MSEAINKILNSDHNDLNLSECQELKDQFLNDFLAENKHFDLEKVLADQQIENIQLIFRSKKSISFLANGGQIYQTFPTTIFFVNRNNFEFKHTN